ncbi:MAG: hypothetical protein H7836_11440 [Magnetococcus sp. YQC-3]
MTTKSNSHPWKYSAHIPKTVKPRKPPMKCYFLVVDLLVNARNKKEALKTFQELLGEKAPWLHITVEEYKED